MLLTQSSSQWRAPLAAALRPRAAAALGLLTAVILILAGSAWPAFAADKFGLTILHMNDAHGRYLPYKDTETGEMVGGFSRAAALIEKIRAENRARGRETLVLFAGDLLTGTPLSMIYKGELGVRLMNRIGFTAMAVGNHEFDQGQNNLMGKLKPMLEFPALSANIVNSEGEFPFKSMIELKDQQSGTKIVIFGLTTENTPTSTHPANVTGLKFLDPTNTAREILAGLHEDDLVIALTHLGALEDRNLAEACPEIDVIVGGHSHTALTTPAMVGRTLIVQAGAYAKYVGRLDLEVERGRVVSHEGKLIVLDASVPDEPHVAAIIEDYKSRMDAKLGEVIGRTDVFLDGSLRAMRTGEETNLGLLAAYLIAQGAQTQVGLINGGAIRSSIPQGPITISDVYTVLPFGNQPVRIELKGAELAAVLQRSADLEIGSGGKLQTYGITRRLEKGKVVIDKVAGEVFDSNRGYSVAVNDFLAAGGDGYELLKQKAADSVKWPYMTSELLANFIKEKKVVTDETIKEIESRAASR
jgi:2',3'-cyclic-nucleotide 2'-phosphodiesterase (5'-nucleotidase family)